GAVLRLAFAGQTVPLVAAPRAPEPGEGVRAFDWDFAKHQRPVDSARYEGVVRSPAGTGGVLEALIGGDSLRVHWPLLVFAADSTPTVVELSDDPRGAGSTDRLVPGRAIPGGSYHWLFPNGTRALVSGRMNDELRLHLAEGLDAWVPYAEALPLPAGLPPPRGRVGSLTISEAPTMAAVRIPVGERLPFLVSESDRRLTLTVYGAGGDVNWIRYGAADSLVRRVGWRQEASDCLRLEFELTRPLWGYRARWLGTDLLIEIRRPPPIDGSAPFRGRLIVVDPGHPPLGATGPTGLREADANLAVARELARLLEEGGARVLLTRTADVPVDLAQRVRLADSVNADLLVSVHQNALPDGLNPFTNTGASVFYNHPRSLPLARAIQDRLVERLGVRDLGVGRGDLALARATWMPAVLTEGLHIIMPDQEAALRSERGRGLYARAVFEGVKDFLKAVSSEQ
ncbi:MAG TPA: N-acetylmuramoyl-L-alanine amidase, partial [Gemmatimonadales bacterium]|nr:N-acetylmuramoyl-L-alanine amidase [Gemmatimonadales bacterium]